MPVSQCDLRQLCEEARNSKGISVGQKKIFPQLTKGIVILPVDEVDGRLDLLEGPGSP